MWLGHANERNIAPNLHCFLNLDVIICNLPYKTHIKGNKVQLANLPCWQFGTQWFTYHPLVSGQAAFILSRVLLCQCPACTMPLDTDCIEKVSIFLSAKSLEKIGTFRWAHFTIPRPSCVCLLMPFSLFSQWEDGSIRCAVWSRPDHRPPDSCGRDRKLFSVFWFWYFIEVCSSKIGTALALLLFIRTSPRTIRTLPGQPSLC